MRDKHQQTGIKSAVNYAEEIAIADMYHREANGNWLDLLTAPDFIYQASAAFFYKAKEHVAALSSPLGFHAHRDQIILHRTHHEILKGLFIA